VKRLASIAFVVGIATFARAELENSIYTSKTEKLRLVVPRGWRATDQPSYPGLLLWMMRSEPEGRIVLTSEPFTRDVYCSWPVRCQMIRDSLPAKAACALGSKLAGQRVRVGPVQGGPKENEDAGLPSVWFEYDDGHHFLRQAIAIDEDHVVSLVLSTPSIEARNANVRAFDQALRTLRPLTPEELGVAPPAPALGSAVSPARAAAVGIGPTMTAGSAAGSATGAGTGSAAGAGSGAASPAGSGAGASVDAGSASGPTPIPFAGSDAGSAAPPPPGTPSYQSAPPPRIEPVGACPRK